MKSLFLLLLLSSTTLLGGSCVSTVENEPPPKIYEIDAVTKPHEPVTVRKLKLYAEYDKLRKQEELKDKPQYKPENEPEPEISEEIEESDPEPEPSPPPEPEAVISVTDDERNLLARLVEAEARSEPYEGKVGVAIVVLNRVLSEKFPNDIRSVIYQKGQFSPVSNGSINCNPSEESYQAVDEAVRRINAGNTLGSLYFYNPKLCASAFHESLTTTTVIGNHVFGK